MVAEGLLKPSCSTVANPSLSVARIAYLSSDLVLSVQPALSIESEFSAHLHVLAAQKIPGIVAKDGPEVRHPQAVCSSLHG